MGAGGVCLDTQCLWQACPREEGDVFTRALGACGLPSGGGHLQGISGELRSVLPEAWLKTSPCSLLPGDAGLCVGSVLYILGYFDLWPFIPVHTETRVSQFLCCI